MATAGDRDNYSGDAVYTAPTGGVTRGEIYNISGIYVVARETADAAASFVGATGVVWATKATGTGKAFVVGEEVFALSNVVDKTATGAVLIGVCRKAAAVGDALVLIDTGTGLPVTAS
jgi:hypothetical protein